MLEYLKTFKLTDFEVLRRAILGASRNVPAVSFPASQPRYVFDGARVGKQCARDSEYAAPVHRSDSRENSGRNFLRT